MNFVLLFSNLFFFLFYVVVLNLCFCFVLFCFIHQRNVEESFTSRIKKKRPFNLIDAIFEVRHIRLHKTWNSAHVILCYFIFFNGGRVGGDSCWSFTNGFSDEEFGTT